MTERRFVAKEIIFNEGDIADFAYVLRVGEVEILKHTDQGEIVLATLQEPGDVLGEMALFEHDSTRSATARAKTGAALDVIDRDEFDELIKQCPQRILPLIHTVLDRLRSSNERLSKKEQATILLDSDIEKITIESATDEFSFEPIPVHLPRLPYAIGGYDEESGKNSKNRQNQLNLVCDGPPLRISRRHCQIEVQDNGLYILDLGSRFNTVVNDVEVGRGKGEYRMPLKKGENTVILGGQDSPYKLSIRCE